MKKGTITGFGGSWLSGIGYLEIDNVPVPCENAPTVRALDGAFGDVISAGHSVDQDAIVGKVIYYSTDDMGLLDGFTPEEDATEEIEEAYAAAQD